MDLLSCMEMLRVLPHLHGVESNIGAKFTAKLLVSSVAVPQMAAEGGLVGGSEITLRAMIGLVCPIVSLHFSLIWEQSPTGVMATFAGRGVMHIHRMLHKFLSYGRLKSATMLEACQWLSNLWTVVHFHVSLEGPGKAETLPASGALVAIPVQLAFFFVHVDEVAADCVLLHSRILAQMTAVDHFSCLAEPVHAKLALACEVTLAGGTLKRGFREVCVEVLLQVGAHLEAASTFGTSMGAKDVF